MSTRALIRLVAGLALCMASAPLLATSSNSTLPAGLTAKIDQVASRTLTATGVPSASIAIVRNGQVVYVKAYGHARLHPDVRALPSMRYSVGSISKEFTAAAIMLLVQDGKLKLDDTVSRFFPRLADADHVTLRELLSHTSGYEDYWPEDYVKPAMKKPTTVLDVIHRWAGQPLNFAPGTKWQYSNTNYAILGAIIHKITGMRPFAFLQEHVFKPLGMHSVYNVDVHPLPAADAQGYERYALGPLRPAPQLGVNWVYGAGELAMTAGDLAKWDISILQQSVLAPSSYRAMETEVRLRNGLGTNYGFGLFVATLDGHRELWHDGEVPGFTADNFIFPDDNMAVVVLTNQDAVNAYDQIAKGIARLLFKRHNPAAARARKQARRIFVGLQHGKLDRAQLTANANSYFSATAVADYHTSLAPLGAPTTFVPRQLGQWGKRAGMVKRVYRATFAHHAPVDISTYAMPDGKLEQYLVFPAG